MSQLFMFSEEDVKASPAHNASLNCEACGLYKHCLNPKIEPYGRFQKRIMLIGEAPGENEDRLGIPFIGKSGSLLYDTLRENGIDMDRDCIRTNACRCRPVNNKTPTDSQIKNCRRYLYEAIEKYKPTKIITLGLLH